MSQPAPSSPQQEPVNTVAPTNAEPAAVEPSTAVEAPTAAPSEQTTDVPAPEASTDAPAPATAEPAVEPSTAVEAPTAAASEQTTEVPAPTEATTDAPAPATAEAFESTTAANEQPATQQVAGGAFPGSQRVSSGGGDPAPQPTAAAEKAVQEDGEPCTKRARLEAA